MRVQEGATYSRKRTITEEDISRFAEISGDKAQHHLERDSEGRLMAQGLLTATQPTKLGGDLDYVPQTLEFEFIRPVFAGNTVTCELEILDLVEEEDRTLMASQFVCRNQDGDEVLKGESNGMLPEQDDLEFVP